MRRKKDLRRKRIPKMSDQTKIRLIHAVSADLEIARWFIIARLPSREW